MTGARTELDARARQPVDGCLAHREADAEQIQGWAETFHTDGFLFLKDVLPPDWCAELRADLDGALGPAPPQKAGDPPTWRLQHRLFETSAANLRLFDLEPIVTFAETVIDKSCHVIHNNSFITPPGTGLSTWHQDDPPHYVVTDGDPPDNVHLPVLFFTANYYLTDVLDPAIGATEVIPGSHLLGRGLPGDLEATEWESRIHANLGPAGSVVLFNNQVWHRGGPNRSEQARYITQITYGRRIIGHMYHPFMNYQMPEHVYKDANERLRRLVGFKPSGAYG